MQYLTGHAGQDQAIIALFNDTFAASEGAAEGALIGEFVRDLLASTPRDDLFVFNAAEGGVLVASNCFSRLVFAGDDRIVFILSPVAVATDWQKKGVGRQLLSFGLEALRRAGVDYAITYGDPNYYRRVGFQPISQAEAPPPMRLSHPQGWLGQALDETARLPLKGASHCVPALNRPDLW